MSPIRLCLEPAYPNPQTGRGRCDEHRRPIERERSRRRREATRGVYKTKRWEMARKAVLARDPICSVCDNTLSTEVDHIIPLSHGGDPIPARRAPGNLLPVSLEEDRGQNAGVR